MVYQSGIYFCCCILFLSLLVMCNACIVQKNYTLYRLVALTKMDRQILYIIHKNYAHSNFLNGVTNEAAIPMHVAVENEYLYEFEHLLNDTDSLYSKYGYYHFNPNPLDHEIIAQITDDDTVLYKFCSFSTILKLYGFWQSKYPNSFKKIIIGSTVEHRDIIILKVSTGSSIPGKKNPAVFILGGEDGKDWISPAVVLNHAKQLLEGSFGKAIPYDAYFLPLLNPDGYSHSLYKDRFWSKNRNIIHPRTMCSNHTEAKGVNLDRNWLFSYRGEKACSKVYLGQYLSEVETYNLSEFLDGIAPRTLAFFNVKGFNNLITIPFAEKDKTQRNYNAMKAIIEYACGDINVFFNKSYYYGTTKRLLFNYTGSSADWVKNYLNVPVVATFYVQRGENIIPDESDIGVLCNEFSRGVNNILAITIDLYGPLFNSQWRHNIYITTLLLINVCIIFDQYICF